MSNHTPGPWKVRGNWYNRIWATVEGPNGEEIIWQSGPYQTLAIFVSDARLIAAAPEMLELLRDVRQYVADANLRGEGYAEINLKAIDALLAKIDGGEA